MRSFVTKPRVSQLVGVIVIESSSGLPAVEDFAYDDATLDLLFDRMAREIAAEPSAEASPVRTVCSASEPVARVAANRGRLIRELDGTARRWQRGVTRR